MVVMRRRGDGTKKKRKKSEMMKLTTVQKVKMTEKMMGRWRHAGEMKMSTASRVQDEQVKKKMKMSKHHHHDKRHHGLSEDPTCVFSHTEGRLHRDKVHMA